MGDYLVMHIDTEFITSVVYTGNGRSYPVLYENEELLWLYFYNDPRSGKVTFGKENKKNFNNLELNYYGDFLNTISLDHLKFNIRSIERPLIELLDSSGLIKVLKDSFVRNTGEIDDEIPTLITFSKSISNSAKQKVVEYLKLLNFKIESYTIPLSELICFYYLKEKKILANNGKSVLFLKATNSTLHLMKLNFVDDYFLLEDFSAISLSGKGYDPRKKSIIKYVITEVNNSTGTLRSADEIDKECSRYEIKSDEWLRQVDATRSNMPIQIRNINFSKAPSMYRDVLVKKSDIESDTGYYINELIDHFNHFYQENIKEKSNLSGVILFGDVFNNDIIIKKFEHLIDKKNLFISSTNSISNVLSVFPKIDIKRYSDNEERIKAFANAEDDIKMQTLLFEKKRLEEEEAKKQKHLESLETEKNKQLAHKQYIKAMSLEKEGKILDAISNIEMALANDPLNKEFIDFSITLKEQKVEFDIKTKQYKALLNEAEKLVTIVDFESAINKYEFARSIFDSHELRNLIFETKHKLKDSETNKKNVKNLLEEVESLVVQTFYNEAKAKLEIVLNIDKLNIEAKERLKEVTTILKQNEKEYNNLVLKAEVCLKAENFDDSIELYNKALVFNMDNSYCDDQLSKIENLRRNALKNKETFDNFIGIADSLFKEHKWLDAKENYQKAIQIYPENNYVNKQTIAIGFKLIEENKRIHKIRKSADEFYNQKLYDSALLKYKELLAIQPDNTEISEIMKNIDVKIKMASFGTREDVEKKPDPKPEQRWEFDKEKKVIESNDNWDFNNKKTEKKTAPVEKKKINNKITKKKDFDF
jgi:tetratricopeptide (TPR) repeat protein